MARWYRAGSHIDKVAMECMSVDRYMTTLSTNAIFRLPATKPQIQVMILILKPHTQKVVLEEAQAGVPSL